MKYKRDISTLSVSCADSDAKLVPLVLSQRESQEPSFERGWHAEGMTGVWPAVLRQHKSIRQNGVAKPQSPFGCQLLSKGALDTAGDS